MSKFTDSVQRLFHRPRADSTPVEQKQESRWEGEGGALHPDDEQDDPEARER
ncbi:hypothetical protein GCM10028798_29730 [Humibacter antri]